MAALMTAVEIEVFFSVKLAKALSLIVNGVRVDDVHHNSDTIAMCLIHKGFELLRSTETGTQCKEIRYLIAE